MIKFSDIDGDVLYINPQLVAAISSAHDGDNNATNEAVIILDTNPRSKFFVKESVEEVATAVTNKQNEYWYND